MSSTAMRSFTLMAALIASVGGARARATDKSWPQKMRALESAYQTLLIDVSSDERFNAPQNSKRIEKQTDEFARLARDLEPKGAPLPDSDPTIPIIAGQFAREAEEAARSLKLGHRPYAREVLKSMVNYCMACHTRSGSGPSFASGPSIGLLDKLSALDRGNFYTVTRRFDQALNEYDKAISDAKSSEHRPFEWEKAVRGALAIAVRVKQDPDRALSIVERVLSMPSSTVYLKDYATQWKKSLQEWKREESVKAQTAQGHHAQAVKLIAAAKTQQEYPADRSADMLYLRASAAVHSSMSMNPDDELMADNLYLAGLTYEVLNDLNLWDQHHFYYQACIVKRPHSERALQCYKHYEKSVYLGYTGSSGTHVPERVRARLKELEQAAKPEGASTPGKLN